MSDTADLGRPILDNYGILNLRSGLIPDIWLNIRPDSLEKYPDSPFKNFLDKPDTELIFGWLPELKKVLWSIPSSNKT